MAINSLHRQQTPSGALAKHEAATFEVQLYQKTENNRGLLTLFALMGAFMEISSARIESPLANKLNSHRNQPVAGD